MAHLSAVPTPQPDDGMWTFELHPHDGEPCPTCRSTDRITNALGISEGHGRLCTICVEAIDPALAAALEAIDDLDAAIALTAHGQPRAVITALAAGGCGYVVETRFAEMESI